MSRLQQPSNTQIYNTAAASWPRGPRVNIRIDDYPQLLSLPLAFLLNSGDNTLGFVGQLMQLLVIEQGQLIDSETASVLDLNDPPAAGQQLAFIPITKGATFTWASEPDGRYQARPHPPSDPFDDSASLSLSQISSLQHSLRELLLVRDGQCIISNSPSHTSQAAHLAPEHRLDIYEASLGNDFYPPPYRSSHAVLLHTDLHKAYDRCKLSFYSQGANLVVHVFNGAPNLHPLHGRVIPPDRFRLFSNEDIEAPDRKLIEWHYQQCVRMYIRGFWAP